MSAQQYYTDDCTIPVPAGFRDRSTNVLEWKTADGDSVALVIHRDELPLHEPEDRASGALLDQYVTRETRGYATKFPGLHMERDDVTTADSGFHMRRKAFRWRNEKDVLYHNQAFVLAGERIIVFTAAAKARHREAVDFLMDDALANFRMRGD